MNIFQLMMQSFYFKNAFFIGPLRVNSSDI